MRVNWMVPLRALLGLIGWIVRQINIWGGIIISIPVLPIVWLAIMMTKGAKRVGRMIKRSMSPSDHELSGVVADHGGWIFGQVDGDQTALGLFAERHVRTRLSKEGLVLQTPDGKTFLVKSFEKGQDSAALAPLLADAFLHQ
ncbi:hypothetical protein [Pseudomonas sp. T8]|uniref:hypothetical protein n=1 Tax=Pseudomonas sp. T8 TaxID=645292 RepID=UPI00214890F1|nr:hypothetical protein [Pseudomonas sp. T8]UUT24051.1 hypothetical protein NRG23_08820 [Pseudomonas sp. T8]